MSRYVLMTILSASIFATTSGGEIHCYACNSYLSQCGQHVDNSRGTLFRSRCAGRCFARQGEDNAIYRGCFDGFDQVPTLVDTYVGCRNQTWNNKQLLWCLCDTNLCNGGDLQSIVRANSPKTPDPSVIHPGRGLAFRSFPPSPIAFAGPLVPQTSHRREHAARHQTIGYDDIMTSSAVDSMARNEVRAQTSGSRNSANKEVKEARRSGKFDNYQGQDHQGQVQSQGHVDNEKASHYLPAEILDRGPYIWTPDGRLPYIVERIPSDKEVQMNPPSDKYFQGNNRNDVASYNYVTHDVIDVKPYVDHSRSMPSRDREATSVGKSESDGEMWWSSSVQKIVNGDSRLSKSSRLPSNDGKVELSQPQWKSDVKSWSPDTDYQVRQLVQYGGSKVPSQNNVRDIYEVNENQGEGQNSRVEYRDYTNNYFQPVEHLAETDQSEPLKPAKSDESLHTTTYASVMDQARCTSDAGYHLYPGDCTLYFVCLIHHNGLVPIVMRCPVGLAWDDTLKLCVAHSTTCRQQSQVSTETDENGGKTRRLPLRADDTSSSRDQRDLEFIYRW